MSDDGQTSHPERGEGSPRRVEEARLLQESGLPAPPELNIVTTLAAELALPVESLAAGLHGALTRPIHTTVRTAMLGLAPPRVVSLPIGRAPAIKTRGFLFP